MPHLRRKVSQRGAKRSDASPWEPIPDLCRLPLSLKLGAFHAEAVYWGIIDRGWWRNHLHSHSFYEVCYCHHGKGVFTIDSIAHDVRAGDVFLARPNHVHEIVSDRRDPMRIVFWGFTLIRDSSMPSTTDRTQNQLLSSLADAERVVAGAQAFDPLLLAMAREIETRQAGFLTVLRGLCERLLIELARAFGNAPTTSEELPESRFQDGPGVVQEAIRYIRDNLARPLEIGDVAAQVGLSERHLGRLFRGHRHQSVLEFITDERIMLASQLLLERELSIKQVARTVGYPDPHYFTTLFGRRTGKTPSEFRRAGGTTFVAGGRISGHDDGGDK
jgi:AraC-like DNA-binding protein